MSAQFTILTVCTGNICRSPAMERLLAHLFRDEPGIEVISGGTYAHDGEDMQEPMKRRIAEYGAETADFTAEQVTPEMIDRADLILAATGVHVRDMLAEVPQAREKIFTHIKFGHLLEDVGQAAQGGSTVEKLAALVTVLDRARREAGAADEEDVVDPYMLPESVFDESFQQIREPVEKLAEVLGLQEQLSEQ
ncbi:arsenate reductase/protein-tyrosine-phosphatase family protein [Nesterenkonia alkaliphila]|uniref:Phosphotyrosine protein phosphatase I domain-containing protein n=1 Tax=Nesterenkonia alkaliphila TaxID=1463631 RepID=A0A7K1UHB0_9MICC|nr:hypothetical protein [Nesterenkonia alkaliphila]MVT25865.1 hypothetical protein [Nesterenkonia alkaliphila]GFZ76540.1 low molecular weight phosphatase family protein [Nesterenkonia alkaliphila]